MNFIIWQAFLSSAFAALICDASKFNNSRYLVSCSDNQFDQGSSYGTDLKNLLSFLSSNATKFDGYYTINTTTIYGSSRAETIYGLFKYRGDITPQDCASCVNNDVQHLPPKECPSDKGVMMWYKECYIRYSNVSFLGNFEEGVHISWRNNENITTLDYDVEGFMRLVGDTLQNLVHQLMSWLNQPTWYSLKEGSKKYFQVNTTMVNNFVRLYTMVQCTRSLAPTDCEECLAIVINEMPVCCNGSRGGQAMSSGCYARFEVYPFYNAFPSSFISQFPLAKGNGKRKKKFLLLTSLLTIFPISATIWLLVLFGNRNFRRMMSKKTCDEIDEIKSTLDSMQYDYTTIKTATCNFSLDNKIRKGGFGDVYKGKLKDGQEIAVKRLSNDTGQGIEQFKTEVVLVAKLQHRNLVKLLGFCVSSKEKMLVFEFLLNSSLDRFLYGSIKKAILDWQTRVKIIVDIARGLLYLHEDSRLKVVHRDLKTSNILLDEFMNPKISDFGLPKHFGVNQS